MITRRKVGRLRTMEIEAALSRNSSCMRVADLYVYSMKNQDPTCSICARPAEYQYKIATQRTLKNRNYITFYGISNRANTDGTMCVPCIVDRLNDNAAALFDTNYPLWIRILKHPWHQVRLPPDADSIEVLFKDLYYYKYSKEK